MSRACLSLLLISGLCAQTANNVFEKAPPDVDAALRDRITKFYQAQVDKKYRQAQAFVAEDSMDTFLGLNKAPCLSFKVDKLVYSDNFTKAKSTVLCNQYLPFPGFEKAVDIPMPDTWKVEDGKWFWYMDLDAGRDTPFGHMSPKTNAPAGGGPIPAMPSLESIMKGVQTDKTAVTLNAKETSNDVVKIANVLTGPVTLSLDAASVPGLKVTLERTELKGGEQTRLLFQSEPAPNRKPFEVRVLVSPINKTIPIQVSFQ